MDQLIKVSKSEGGKSIVSAKDLYEFLGFEKSQWSRWAKKNIEKNPYAEEMRDWMGFDIMSNGNQSRDFYLTIDFAKRLSMLARTEKGEQIRNYFIACEQELLKPKTPTTYLEAMKEVVRLEEERLALESKIEEDAPKVRAAEELLTTGDNITVGEFAKILGTGQNLFFEWLRNHKYLIALGAKKNLPYQNYLQMGIFDVKETVVGPEGNTRLHSQTFITPKGQVYLTGKYKH